MFEETLVRCPVENSLTRKMLPRNEIKPASAKLYGYKWPTIAGMFTPHASDVTFDIDLVFSGSTVVIRIFGRDARRKCHRSLSVKATTLRRESDRSMS